MSKIIGAAVGGFLGIFLALFLKGFVVALGAGVALILLGVVPL